jgi:hypothetical protein
MGEQNTKLKKWVKTEGFGKKCKFSQFTKPCAVKHPISKRGGKRTGSGQKPKYNEETKTVAFRCPISKVDELKIIVNSKLSEWSIKK